MAKTVLKIEDLSKVYRLGEVGTGTISHDLNRWWANIRGKEDPNSIIGQVNDRSRKSESDFVYALKDINFEVKEGDVLGVIGKNGAGKSTLLKLISKITAPTTGSIKAKGRIASLLEVGTGMHPEMTARENIYLNGAILGMRKSEITKKFDEIIDFAGCLMYVDTPVKRFSSGMRVRLGFAVAAFLEPEILIVDEVLAVGDLEFQKKAIGKMKDVSSTDGRTVLFVSHNMVSVKGLCEKGIVLENGELAFSDTADNAVAYYQNASKLKSELEISKRKDIQGNRRIEITKVRFCNENGNEVNDLISGKKCSMVLDYKVNEKFNPENLFLGITILDANDIVQTVIATDELGFKFSVINSEGKIKIDFNKLSMRAGQFVYTIFISNKLNTAAQHEKIFCLTNAGNFNVLQGDYWGVGNVNRPNGFIVDAKISLT